MKSNAYIHPYSSEVVAQTDKLSPQFGSLEYRQLEAWNNKSL